MKGITPAKLTKFEDGSRRPTITTTDGVRKHSGDIVFTEDGRSHRVVLKSEGWYLRNYDWMRKTARPLKPGEAIYSRKP